MTWRKRDKNDANGAAAVKRVERTCARHRTDGERSRAGSYRVARAMPAFVNRL